MSARADLYVRVALAALTMARTPQELGLWWSEEESARQDAGITEDQEADLVAARDAHRDRLLARPERTYARGRS